MRKLRKRIFFGVEGESEKSLIVSLRRFTDNIHPIIENLKGSSNISMLEKAVIRRDLEKNKGKIINSFLIIDSDKLGLEGNLSEANIKRECAENNFKLILFRPNIEGLYLRMFPEFKNKKIHNIDTFKILKKVWPDYDKTLPAIKLSNKFSLEEFKKASIYCDEIKELLESLEI